MPLMEISTNTADEGLVDWGRPDKKTGSGIESQSLQDAFARFRRERKREAT